MPLVATNCANTELRYYNSGIYNYNVSTCGTLTTSTEIWPTAWTTIPWTFVGNTAQGASTAITAIDYGTCATTITNNLIYAANDFCRQYEQIVVRDRAQDDTAWQRWNGEYFETVQATALTEDQQREWRLRNEERLSRQRAAAERAKQLFLDWLSPEQRVQFEREAIVDVRASRSGRRYRIRASEAAGRHGNIFELDARGREIAKLCCAPGGMDLPHFDAICGQKLALELDEDEFRRRANFTPLVPDYQRAVA